MTEPKQRKSKRSSKVSRQSSKSTREEKYVPDVAEVLVEPSNTAAQSAPVKSNKVKKSKSKKLSKKSSSREEAPRENGEKVKRKKKVPKVVEEVPREEAPREVVEEVPAAEFAPVEFSRLTSRRGLVSREELEGHFDQYITFLERELDASRSDKNRKVSVKTFRTLIKEAKVLKSNSVRAMKKPKKQNSNAQSGFMKPVAISSEMASFAGWDPSELKSRVDVARYLCNYIKDNELQNPEDRRQILADKKLAKLLDYNPDKEDKLTYYYLQKKIQPLFNKN